MKQCPTCRAQAFILETRQNPGYTYRRYRCENNHRYTTNEIQVFEGRSRVDTKQLLVALKSASKRI